MAGTTNLPDWELDQLRAELGRYYPDECTISRHSSADDNYGGTTETPTVIATAVPCAIEGGVAHDQERMIAEKIQEREFFTIVMPAFTDVQVDDTITVTSQPGMEVRVAGVIGPESYELERRVLGYRHGV